MTAARIVLIQPQAEGAGAQEIARLIDRGLQARGYEVHHLFFFRRTAAFDGLPNAIFCAPERPGGLGGWLRMFARLLGHLRRLRPDAALCFQHYGTLLGAPAARLAGVRTVIANRNSARALMPRWMRAIDGLFGTSGLYSRIVVNSADVENDFVKHPGNYRRRLVRIDHGFECKTTALTRREARTLLQLPADAVLLGSMARLHSLKNLAAAIRLLPLDARWHLALAGQGPEQPALAALAHELGCAERVHFLGELSPDRVGALLRALDVFVFPSLAETFGLAAVEAAQAGVPVVAHDLDVLREVLSIDGEPCALFVDSNDTREFAGAVRRILDDAALATALRARAVRLSARYSLDTMVDAYAAVLHDELRQRKLQNAVMKKPNDQTVTSRLNEVYGPGREDSSLDSVVAALQERTLKRNG
jgi:glycosyltransferase involved in cell wall biosynthesis